MELWSTCKAIFEVLLGTRPRHVYEKYIQDRGIKVQVVNFPHELVPGKNPTSGPTLRPTAYLDLSGSDISRIVIAVPHPEDFRGRKGSQSGAAQRYNALKERLLDLIDIYAYGSLIKPSLLSSIDYFESPSSGFYVPRYLFDTGRDDELRIALRGPHMAPNALRCWLMECQPNLKRQDIR